MTETVNIQTSRARLKLRERAMDDLFFFAKEILNYPDLEPEFHGEVCKWFQEWPKVGTKDAMYRLTLLPRGHFKTTVGTVAHTIWEWLWDPQLNFLNVHFKLDQTKANLAEIKTHFEQNEKLRDIAPDICYRDPRKESPLWHDDRIMIKRPRYHRVPSFLASSQDASVVGLHFDRFKIDDLVVEESVTTEQQRAKAIEWVRSALGLRRVPAFSRFDIIGTHWHPDDLYAFLQDPGKGFINKNLVAFVRGCFGNRPDGRAYTGEEPEATPLFKSRFNKQDLLEMKQNMGSYKFSCLMLNDPISSDVLTFRHEAVQFFDPNLFKFELATPGDRTWAFFTLVDPNRKTGEQHDPGVVLTVARNDIGQFYVVQCDYQRFSVDSLVETCKNHVLTWKPEFLGIETTAGQIFLLDPIRKSMDSTHWGTTVKEIHRGAMNGKSMRILRCQPVVDNGRLFIPSIDQPGCPGGTNHPLFKEIRVYGTAGKTHDHALDALSDVVQYGWNPRPRIEQPKARGQWVLSRVLERNQMGASRKDPRSWRW